MEKMNDLRDLLRHDVQDLYSAEEQLIAAMPRMIEKATNPALKEALQQHLQITEEQRRRLEQVQQLLMEGERGGNQEGGESGERPGLMARLFRRRSDGGEGGQVCRAMQGIVEEGERIMAEDMNPEVMDAAIIGSAQKAEHYEICGYGTARAFARELNLGQVAELLEQTLDEEYEADDRLTDLAVGDINERAEKSKGGSRRSSGGGRSSGGSKSSGGRGGSSKGSSKGASKGGSKSASKGASKGGSKSGGGGSSKGGSKSGSKGGSKSGSKGASKGGSSKGASKGGNRGGSKGASKSGGGRSGGSKAPSKAAAAKGGRNSRGGRGR